MAKVYYHPEGSNFQVKWVSECRWNRNDDEGITDITFIARYS
jgi:hypothetical protein